MPNLKRRWTVDDLDDLRDDGSRYEVIDGDLFVTPSPSWRHQEAIAELHGMLRAYLRRERVGHAFFAPADVIFSPNRGVQPDIFVVPLVGGHRPGAFADVGRLLLAVEVLSPTTARADRVAKRTLFREEGVTEYWVVDLESRTIERSTPSESRVEVLVDEMTWAPDGVADPLVINVAEYFARVLGDEHTF